MKIGISTACFYPETTERALDRIAALGVDQAEIFVNSPSESTPAAARRFRKQAQKAGIRLVAFHPFTSFAESYCLFSSYERRRRDFYEIYRRYFAAAAQAGCRVFHFHGALADTSIPVARYCEIYSHLFALAQKEGVLFSQENVWNFLSGRAAFLLEMHRLLGNEVCFTLDIKQAMRRGEDPLAIREAMGDRIVHLHLNDWTASGSCVLPGQGCSPYKKLLDTGLRGDEITKVVEVYRSDFSADSDLLSAIQSMNNF